MPDVLFPRWKDVPEVEQAVQKITDLAGRHKRLLALGTSDGRVEAQKVWTSLSGVYWELLFALVDAQTKKQPAQLSFDENERLFIDFGYLANGILPASKDFDPEVALDSRCEPGIFSCLAFSDYIAECWAMITGKDLPVPVIGLPLSRRVEALQEQLAKAQFRRDDILMELTDTYAPTSPLDVRKMAADMDRLLMTATKVSMRVPEYREAGESVRQSMAQDRYAYQETEKSVALLLSTMQKNEGNPLPAVQFERITQLHELTKILAKKILYCQVDVKKVARRAKKITDACAGLSPQMKRGELRNMLIKKKEYLSVTSKTARCDGSLFCPSDAAPVDYQHSASELEAMCSMDMDMFNVPRIRMYGVPRVIFVPGQGLGTYDWSDHSMLIPAYPVGGEAKSLTYALGTFRWDSDEDRRLKNPYETQIKDNKKKSLVAMAASFYKDYFLWMTKEKKGYRILPRETHKVFIQMFASRPDE